MNHQYKTAGQAFVSKENWGQVDGIAGKEINGWVLFSGQEGVWTRRNVTTVFADADVEKRFKEPAKLAIELRKAKAEIEKAKADVASTSVPLSGQKRPRDASDNYRKAQQSLDKALEPLWAMLTNGDQDLSKQLEKLTLENWVMNYKVGAIPPRVFLSNERDWVLIYFGTGFFSQYLITWKIEAFSSPLLERTLFSLEDLVAYFLSSPQEQGNTIYNSNTRNGASRNEGHAKMELREVKQDLLNMLAELAQRCKAVIPSKSSEHRKINLRPINPGSLNFLAGLLKEIDGHDGPITQDLVAKLYGHEDNLEKAAKNWEPGDIFKLWRLLPRRPPPDKAREALARVLAEQITKNAEGRDKVLEFLADYQDLMDQNGMDKTAPHPLYYMILSRKSRGAISTLIDACEDDTLLSCTDWTVDKGAYEPRVWQTLLDGLTDRLTLKFHRDIYDADGFDQSRRIVENLKEMIEAGKLPEQMREVYRWRLVSLVREALCRAENATEDQNAETGGATKFKNWAENDFVPHLSFVQDNPQMKAMFENTKLTRKE